MKKNVELTTQQIAELKQNASKILENCRVQLLNRHPFVGAIAMSLNIVPIRDCRCETACTDGNSIFFDIDFLSKLSDAEREGVIGHEIWHIVMMHFVRNENRDRNIFNIATDIEVNEILMNDGFTLPKDCCTAKKFNVADNLCAEEYYDILLQRNKYNELFNNQNNASDRENRSNENSQRNRKSRRNQNGNENSNQFDRHIYQHDNIEEEMNSERNDRYGKVTTDNDFNPVFNKNLVEKIRESVIRAAQQVQKSHGTLPGNVQTILDKLLKPQISWKELLAAQITSAFCNKTNWNKPNRRFAYEGLYLPSHQGETLKIGIGVDTSGSCVENFNTFITEINSIAKTFGSYEIHLIQCDTQVQKYDLYDEGNPLNVEENPVQFKGFGGTNLKPIFDYVNLNELEIDQLIIFTDGAFEFISKDYDPGIPTIWAITGNQDVSPKTYEFGEPIFLKF